MATKSTKKPVTKKTDPSGSRTKKTSTTSRKANTPKEQDQDVTNLHRYDETREIQPVRTPRRDTHLDAQNMDQPDQEYERNDTDREDDDDDRSQRSSSRNQQWGDDEDIDDRGRSQSSGTPRSRRNNENNDRSSGRYTRDRNEDRSVREREPMYRDDERSYQEEGTGRYTSRRDYADEYATNRRYEDPPRREDDRWRDDRWRDDRYQPAPRSWDDHPQRRRYEDDRYETSYHRNGEYPSDYRRYESDRGRQPDDYSTPRYRDTRDWPSDYESRRNESQWRFPEERDQRYPEQNQHRRYRDDWREWEYDNHARRRRF